MKYSISVLAIIFSWAPLCAQWNAEASYDVNFHEPDYTNANYIRHHTTEENMVVMHGKNGAQEFRKMVDYYWDKVSSGSPNAYHLSPLLMPDFNRPMSAKEFADMNTMVDTVYTENLQTREFEPSVATYYFEKEEVSGINLYQKWYYDNDEKKLITRVYAIGLLRAVRGEDGEIRGYAPLVLFSQPSDDITLPGSVEWTQTEQLEDYQTSLLEAQANIIWGHNLTVSILCFHSDAADLNEDRADQQKKYLAGKRHGKYMPTKRIWGFELSAILHRNVMAGKMKAYEEGTCENPLSTTQVEARVNYVDTIYSNYGELETEVLIQTIERVSELNYGTFPAAIQQNFLFDPETGIITAPVAAIGVKSQEEESVWYWVKN
jgi:hypothetical protein